MHDLLTLKQTSDVRQATCETADTLRRAQNLIRFQTSCCSLWTNKTGT